MRLERVLKNDTLEKNMLNDMQHAPITSWFWYSLTAFFLMGLQGFLYKVAAERRCDTARVTSIFMSTVAVLSFVLWAYLREPIGNLTTLTILALINSLSFLVATMAFIEALKSVPSTTAFSVMRLNLVILTIFSVAWFHDRLSPYQMSGIAISLAAMLVLSKNMSGNDTPKEQSRRGAVFLVISLFASAVAGISSKFAAMYVGKLSFLTIVYTIAALFSLAFTKKQTPVESQGSRRITLVVGIAMGVLNFVGYYSFLSALSHGPLSLVASITGMHFVISVILSVFIYRETLTPGRVIGFLLTIASLLLLRIE
jgi:drug/metabolite transporter (DMT)-like permease